MDLRGKIQFYIMIHLKITMLLLFKDILWFYNLLVGHGIFICHQLLRTTDDKIGICCISTKHSILEQDQRLAMLVIGIISWNGATCLRARHTWVKTGWHDFLLCGLEGEKQCRSHTWKIHQFMQKHCLQPDIYTNYLYKTLFTPRHHYYETFTHEKNWGWTLVLWKGR